MKLISRLNTLLLIITITFAMDEVVISQNDSLKVSILNDYIKIPAHDSTPCIDTIYILVENNTKYNYIFAFENSEIMFYDHHVSKDYDFITDPFEGVAVKFLNKDSLMIKVDASSGYDPEAFENVSDFTPKSNIKCLYSNESITLKAVLEFPNSNVYGTLTQEVRGLNEASQIEIIFAPPEEKSRKYLMNNQTELGDMDKILDVKERFIVKSTTSCR